MSATLSRTWTIKANTVTVKAARVALEVQDACNMLAVIGAMYRLMQEMRDANRADNVIYDGNAECQHPVVLMFLDKLNSLARTQVITSDQDEYVVDIYKRLSKAQDACMQLQSGVDVDWQIINPF